MIFGIFGRLRALSTGNEFWSAIMEKREAAKEKESLAKLKAVRHAHYQLSHFLKLSNGCWWDKHTMGEKESSVLHFNLIMWFLWRVTNN